jgi:hypothetical protein
MEEFTKVNGRLIKCTEMANLLGLIKENMWDNTFRIKSKGMGLFIGLMADNFR